jgi:hypothetical protein
VGNNRVYIIGSDEPEMHYLYKVGSGNPERRLKGLQTGCPFKLRVFDSFCVRDREWAFYLEKMAHDLLVEYRVPDLGCREWFRCRYCVVLGVVEKLLNEDAVQSGVTMIVSRSKAHLEWKVRNGQKSRWGRDNELCCKGLR